MKAYLTFYNSGQLLAAVSEKDIETVRNALKSGLDLSKVEGVIKKHFQLAGIPARGRLSSEQIEKVQKYLKGLDEEQNNRSDLAKDYEQLKKDLATDVENLKKLFGFGVKVGAATGRGLLQLAADVADLSHQYKIEKTSLHESLAGGQQGAALKQLGFNMKFLAKGLATVARLDHNKIEAAMADIAQKKLPETKEKIARFIEHHQVLRDIDGPAMAALTVTQLQNQEMSGKADVDVGLLKDSQDPDFTMEKALQDPEKRQSIQKVAASVEVYGASPKDAVSRKEMLLGLSRSGAKNVTDPETRAEFVRATDKPLSFLKKAIAAVSNASKQKLQETLRGIASEVNDARKDSDWWDSKDPEWQADYIKQHPNSKYAKSS